MEPELRLRVLSRSAIGESYQTIADELGISKYKVSEIINNAEADAEGCSPEEVLVNEVVVGGIQMAMSGSMDV